jgi:phosphate-selective porin OprO and OprP
MTMLNARIFAVVLTTMTLAGTALPQTSTNAPAAVTNTATVQPDAKEKSAFDQAWGLTTLYKNDQNPYLEEFDFTGRLQVDYFHVSSDKGVVDFTEIRRFRMGVDSWFADRHVEIKATVDTALYAYHAPSVYYNRFTDLYLNIHVNDALNLRVGKFEPHFGYDREFSDIQQKFFERGILDDQVFNNTGNDYVAGVSALGKLGNLGYQAAIFSDNVGKEYGLLNGGASELFELNYDFSRALVVDKALWAVDYMSMQNNSTPNANVFNTMHNAAATYFDFKQGRFGFVTQFGYGNGNRVKGDVYALTIMPSYYVIPEKLEAVVRYQFATSDDPNGIALMNRQDKTVGSFTGDTYDSVYLGLSYYIYGHKFKLMTAEQLDYLTGGTGAKAGFQGWTTLAGFRMYW